MEELDDLLSIMGDLEASESKISDVKSEVDINLLDDNKDTSNEIIKSPDYYLSEYTNKQNEIDDALKLIADFEESNKGIFDAYKVLKEKVTLLETEQSTIKENLLESMGNSETKNIGNKRFKVTYVAATTRENFDKDKFKKKYPVLYNEFIKVSDVKHYLKIKEA